MTNILILFLAKKKSEKQGSWLSDIKYFGVYWET